MQKRVRKDTTQKFPINTELDADSAKASYTNGILELKINLKKAPKPKVREVRVE